MDPDPKHWRKSNNKSKERKSKRAPHSPLPLGPAGQEDNRRHALAEQLRLLVHVHHGELEHGAGRSTTHPEEEPGSIPVFELCAPAIGPRPQLEADVRFLRSGSAGLGVLSSKLEF